MMNNMVRVLLKKGLVNDLARIPHCLDLSSPRMANTMNIALKPLETLSRIVNQPVTLSSKITKQKNLAPGETGAADSQPSDDQAAFGEKFPVISIVNRYVKPRLFSYNKTVVTNTGVECNIISCLNRQQWSFNYNIIA